MSYRGFIFLTLMGVILFVWYQGKNKAQISMTNEFTHLICHEHLLPRFNEALDLQKKDKEALIARNFPGLQAAAAREREDLSRLKAFFTQITAARNEFQNNAEELAWQG